MSLRVWASQRYALQMGGHPLKTSKFWLAAQALVRDGLLEAGALAEPGLPSRETLRRVHREQWAAKVWEGRLTARDLERAELADCPGLAEAHLRAVQGTVEACRDALEGGLGLHAGGGAHHAFADHGEGYCLLNDLAAGVAWARSEGLARALVVDLDVHQGNGTASIFAGDPEVFTFSMHQEDLYPELKTSGSLDIGLPAGTGDAAYLDALGSVLPGLLDAHRPGLVLYQAGADPYEHDRLGGLKLSRRGLERRDRRVFEECFKRAIPVAVSLGGGYAFDPEDTVAIHAATLRAAIAGAPSRPAHARLYV